MLSIGYLILGALGLGLLVFIHELGHYFAARRVGIKVEAFSIGFGRPVISWMRKGVQWRVGWLPFGGYVRMAGMEKDGERQPYEIPGGFFHARPIDRIKVALAGPIVNIVFAFLLFSIIWFGGGREKPFQDYSNRVGWVDPQSELYQKGVRPGDIITAYDGHPFDSAQDHLYAAMLASNGIEVEGYHVDYRTGERTPFAVQATPYQDPKFTDGIKTTGVLEPARYLLYMPPKGESMMAGSPMVGSGIKPKDRVLWVDGELIFSMAQLSHILQKAQAMVTIERGGEELTLRVPRVSLRNLALTPDMEAEVRDWYYESKGEGRFFDAYFIPYNLSPTGVVEGREGHLAPNEPDPLQIGDQILAIDGKPVTGGIQIFDALQEHQVHIIVQHTKAGWPLLSWEEANAQFDQGINWSALNQLAGALGGERPIAKGDLELLKPIVPATLSELARAPGASPALQLQLDQRRQQILEIEDPVLRSESLRALEELAEHPKLGLPLADRPVRYNPPPTTLFGQVLVQTWRTLTSLFSGDLSPKWLSGPVGIVTVMQYGWSVGVMEALYWLGLISLNLGILNLLPIPVLDGGHICFSLWEMITRRRLKAETMEKLVIPFVVLLIAFFVFVTYQDLSRLFRGFF